ncbi:MAG: 50S ribosomal protein L15 [Candidatus Eisenbacteria sp.]|nr:50S ribosomal protein L15 [Candidatus Eisenbacteria bacterium]
MRLSDIQKTKDAFKKRKRVGRGPGSGHGKTSCRGHKGQKQRAKVHRWLEGGQMPLQRRVPKRGFRNRFTTRFQVLNLKDLERFSGDQKIDPAVLENAGLVRLTGGPIKVLAGGEISRPLEIWVHAASQKARDKIKAAGGKLELIQ